MSILQLSCYDRKPFVADYRAGQGSVLEYVFIIFLKLPSSLGPTARGRQRKHTTEFVRMVRKRRLLPCRFQLLLEPGDQHKLFLYNMSPCWQSSNGEYSEIHIIQDVLRTLSSPVAFSRRAAQLL